MRADAAAYWEARAAQYGHVARGLPAICSYGMPRLYNEAIHACQSRALARHLRTIRDKDVLDIGCGVGRWSLGLAKQGNRVVGVDISPRMVQLATERGAELGLECEFRTADVVSLDLGRQFDFILGVTVLQHVVEESDLRLAVRNIAAHLRNSGTLVLLEVAPTGATNRCESGTFRSRELDSYAEHLSSAGLKLIGVTGVDVAPLRPLLLPATKALPLWLGRGLVTASTLLSLPIDLLASRHFPNACWHKVLVAERA